VAFWRVSKALKKARKKMVSILNILSRPSAMAGGHLLVAVLRQLVAGPDAVDVEALSQGTESVSTDSSRDFTPSSEVYSLLAKRDVEAIVVIRRRGRLVFGLAFEQFVLEKHILVLSDLTLGQRSRADAHNVSFQEGTVDTTDGVETTASVIGISRSQRGSSTVSEGCPIFVDKHCRRMLVDNEIWVDGGRRRRRKMLE
jgi:hypothetical protein